MSNTATVHIALHGLDALPDHASREIVVLIRRELGPLVHAAGKDLRITTGTHSADINLDFDNTPNDPTLPICRGVTLGMDAEGVVFVDSHRQQRVCGVRDAKTNVRDTRRVLTTDVLLGRALANSALHEIGHFVANLEHVKDSTNYMVTGGPHGAERTLTSVRQFLAGPQSFTADQKQRLEQQFATGEWLGDIQVSTVPVSPKASPATPRADSPPQ